MLQLVDIKKDYAVAGEKVNALKGISLNFRKSEFVSILGPSGCGKTTLLNIIGGLDKYTSGDLIISGKSTKQYSDRDWDTYRNHSIGFIFQSYHLIPHQSILQNVELALMIAGVSKEERRERAIEALDRVGLKDKIKNRPNQLSGGQAQRVAIARALVNDPEIVLADEPTGALDSVTSVQIMELLKEISKDRLVIMVTHNPELAEQYSTRIVRLKDGEVTGDTMPYDGAEEEKKEEAEVATAEQPEEEQSAEQSDGQLNGGGSGGKKVKNKGGKKQASMSIKMAMGLSVKNLLSKRKRTAMVSIAGSIGIIGVSMVLAISSGVQNYINGMENDMLSGYPVAITRQSYDFTSLMDMSGNDTKIDIAKLEKDKKVYVNSLLDTLGSVAKDFQRSNNITDAYVDYVNKIPEEYYNVVQYGYDFQIVNNLYTQYKVSNDLSSHFGPEDTTEYQNEFNMSVAAIRSMYSSVLSHVEGYSEWGNVISSVSTFSEIPNNFDYVMSQYDVMAIDKDGNAVNSGYTEEDVKKYFEDKSALIMVIGNNYTIDDLTLAQYGYFTQDDFLQYAYKGIDPSKETTLVGADGFPYSYFIGNADKTFTYYPNDCIYEKSSVTMNTIPDAMVTAMLSQNLPPETAQQLAAGIIASRNVSNAELKKFLSQNRMGAYYDYFKIYDAPEVIDTFTASAYSDGYEGTIVTDSGVKNVSLPAFNTKDKYDDRVDMSVKLILRKKDSISYGCLETGFYYTNALTKYILETEATSEIVKSINEKGDLKTAPSMYVDYYYVDEEAEKFGENHNIDPYVFVSGDVSSVETGGNILGSLISGVTGGTSSGISAGVFGGSDVPTGIYIYPVDFEYKNKICDYLDKWNDWSKIEGGYVYEYTDEAGNTLTYTIEAKDKITYTDTVGMIIDMINTMIQMITIALIAFTALSLVVSTVMIGIITYVSVVERVKEIGILRAVGARKKDIKRLFNAETFIIGLIAGLFGILVTYLLSLVVNIIVLSLAGIWGIAALPWWQAIIMVVLSVGLTLISGLIPAAAAAKKDPVVALRTE